MNKLCGTHQMPMCCWCGDFFVLGKMNLSTLCLLNIRLSKTFTLNLSLIARFELPFKQLDFDSDINWKQSLAISHQNSVFEKEQDICKSPFDGGSWSTNAFFIATYWARLILLIYTIPIWYSMIDKPHWTSWCTRLALCTYKT
jgi:hypothetical protein